MYKQETVLKFFFENLRDCLGAAPAGQSGRQRRPAAATSQPAGVPGQGSPSGPPPMFLI